MPLQDFHSAFFCFELVRAASQPSRASIHSSRQAIRRRAAASSSNLRAWSRAVPLGPLVPDSWPRIDMSSSPLSAPVCHISIMSKKANQCYPFLLLFRLGSCVSFPSLLLFVIRLGLCVISLSREPPRPKRWTQSPCASRCLLQSSPPWPSHHGAAVGSPTSSCLASANSLPDHTLSPRSP